MHHIFRGRNVIISFILTPLKPVSNSARNNINQLQILYLTITFVSELAADYLSFISTPKILTNCAPTSCPIQLHSPSHSPIWKVLFIGQANVSITLASCLGCNNKIIIPQHIGVCACVCLSVYLSVWLSC